MALPRTAILNIVGLTRSLLGPHTPRLNAFVTAKGITPIRPAFPAVTCTAQVSYLTGFTPAQHGVVGNGWYDRDLAEVHFWKQSNRLVRGLKLWDKLRISDGSFTCAKLFWWYNMYSTVDWAITPRPLYPADGRKIFDIHTTPLELRPRIKEDLGDFPFPAFWGPRAGIDSSRWIAESARWIEEKHAPTLNLVYLPHLDYNLQRFGPNDSRVEEDLRQIDAIAGDLIDFFQARRIQVAVLSEYGISEVSRPVHLNRLFRAKGWLSIKDELGLEAIDCGGSKVFAVADHQVAHIYVRDSTLEPEVRALLENEPGIEMLLDRRAQERWDIRHSRTGDFVAVAKARHWFTYYYWEDDAVAPDYARTIDIHRKIGYDPAELFIDPALSFPKLHVAAFLLKKKLGLRGLLNVIPLDATLVRGSHGRCPEDEREWPVLIGPPAEGNVPPLAHEVHGRLLRFCGGRDLPFIGIGEMKG